MRKVALGATAAVLCLLAGCSSDSEPSSTPTQPTPPTQSTSAAVPRTGSPAATSDQSKARDSALAEMAANASSHAAQIASGDGLRVENHTDADVALVFPDGMTAWVKPGKYLVAAMPCARRLPVRAETAPGAVLEEYDAPCRQRDTWVID